MKPKDGDLRGLAKRYIFSTPKSFVEALWRGVSLWMLSTVMGVSWFFIQYPEKVVHVFDWQQSLSQAATGSRRKEVVELIDTFVDRTKPIRLALVSRTEGVGVQLVWNSDQLGRRWPTSIDGVLSDNIRPILGHLIFEECWEGDLGNDGRHYVLCGLNSPDGHVGFLIAEKEKPCENFAKDFRLLAGEIVRILF